MKFSDEVRLAAILAVWGFLGIGAFGWAIFVVLDHFGATKDAAAWVQAVGSVAAIVAAIWISSWQQRKATIERQRQNYRYMFQAFQAASGSVATLVNVVEHIAAGELGHSDIAYYKAVLNAAENELVDFSSRDMVDVHFASVWVNITRHLALTKSRIDAYAEEPTLIPRAMNIDLVLEVVPAQLEELQGYLEAHSIRVGPDVYEDLHL